MSLNEQRGAVLCVHEDRPLAMIGAKLAVLSSRSRCPALPVILSCPTPSQNLIDWANTVPGLALSVQPELKDAGWNVKPLLLQRLLDAGYEQVIWLDSDIIVHHDVLSKLTTLPLDTFAATEETYWGQSQGTASRTSAWGLDIGTPLAATVNSGVLRATKHHAPLLAAWQQLLQHPLYRRAQAVKPSSDCPLHMVTDQDVLSALLGSRDFAGIPIFLLKRGDDIAQCRGSAGFTPMERLRCLRSGLPGLVHSMGPKPWERASARPPVKISGSSAREWLECLHMELSPYGAVAQEFESATGESLDWAAPNSAPAKFLNAAFGGNAVLREFPLAVFDSAAKWLRRRMNIGRNKLHPEFCLAHSPLAVPQIPEVQQSSRAASNGA